MSSERFYNISTYTGGKSYNLFISNNTGLDNSAVSLAINFEDKYPGPCLIIAKGNDFDDKVLNFFKKLFASNNKEFIYEYENISPQKLDIGSPRGWALEFNTKASIANALSLMLSNNIFDDDKNDRPKITALINEFEHWLEKQKDNSNHNDYETRMLMNVIRDYKLVKDNIHNAKNAEYIDYYQDVIHLIDIYEKKSNRNKLQLKLCDSLKDEIKIKIPEQKGSDHIKLLIGALLVAKNQAEENHKQISKLAFLGSKSSLAKNLDKLLKIRGINESNKSEYIDYYYKIFPKGGRDPEIKLSF